MSDNELSSTKKEYAEIKKKYELLEKEVNHLQIENAKKDKQIKKLQDDIQIYTKQSNNTSADFPWPNEFKKNWENVISTILMDSFDNVYPNNTLLALLVNTIVKILYLFSKDIITKKIHDILHCLGVTEINNEITNAFFLKFQLLLFQQYYKTLFVFKDEHLSVIKNQIQIEVSELQSKNIIHDQNDLDNINKDLNSTQINKFIKEIYSLCVYMHLHDPPLIMKTSTDLIYNYFNKNEFINIEGFPKENSVCLTILNPPMLREGKYFKGLKPAVYICENPTKEIIEKCDLNVLNAKINYANTTTPTLYSTNGNVTTPSLTSTINKEKRNEIKEEVHQSNHSHSNSLRDKGKDPQRSRSTNKHLPNFLMKCQSIKNERNDLLNNKFKKSISPILKQPEIVSNMTTNNAINPSTASNILQKAKKAENIFSSSTKLLSATTINKNFNNINNIISKKQKCFTISIHEDQKQNEHKLPNQKKLSDYLRFSKSNSQNKLIDKSRNSSVYDLESANNSSKKSDNNLNNFDRKLVTEVNETTKLYLHTPVPKRKHSNDISPQSKSSYKPQNTNANTIRFNTNINMIIANSNQKRQVKTTIKKLSSGTSYLRKIMNNNPMMNTINSNHSNHGGNNTKKINKLNYKNLNYNNNNAGNGGNTQGVKLNLNNNNNFDSFSYRNSESGHSVNI